MKTIARRYFNSDARADTLHLDGNKSRQTRLNPIFRKSGVQTMRINLITTSLVLAAGIALSTIAVPANAASSCAAMFTKAETMFADKGGIAVDKKVKGYQMAIDSYRTCSKALAMANGAKRDTTMKKAETEFAAVYDFILNSPE
jgi:hypothetical protein